jgi:hypothetical protein
LVRKKYDDANYTCYTDSQEAKTCFSNIESIYFRINERETFEERVINAIRKRSLGIARVSTAVIIPIYGYSRVKKIVTNIYICKEYSWVFEHDFSRLNQGVPENARSTQLFM